MKVKFLFALDIEKFYDNFYSAFVLCKHLSSCSSFFCNNFTSDFFFAQWLISEDGWLISIWKMLGLSGIWTSDHQVKAHAASHSAMVVDILPFENQAKKHYTFLVRMTSFLSPVSSILKNFQNNPKSYLTH